MVRMQSGVEVHNALEYNTLEAQHTVVAWRIAQQPCVQCVCNMWGMAVYCIAAERASISIKCAHV